MPIYLPNTPYKANAEGERDATAALAFPLSRPQLPVERAILNGFGYVVGGDLFRAGQIGNRARDLKNAIVGAGA